MNKRGFGVIIAILAVFLVSSVSALTVSLETPDDNYADSDGIIDNLRWSATNTSEDIDNWTLYFFETTSAQRDNIIMVANQTNTINDALFISSNNNWSISDFQSFTSSNLTLDSYIHWAVYLCDNNSECIWSENRTIYIDQTDPIISLGEPSDSLEVVGSKFVSENTYVRFNYNVSDYGITNCSLLINGQVNSTVSSVTPNALSIIDVQLSNDTYNWGIQCYDKVGRVNTSEGRQVKVNCTEDWTCGSYGDWGSCSSGTKTRTRSCTDHNICGTTANKLSESSSDDCSTTSTSSSSGGGSSTSSSSSSSVEEIGSSVTFSGDAGDEKKYSFTEDVGFTGMEITLKTSVDGGTIDVEKISKPSDVSAPNGIIYTYIRVDKVDITDDNIDEVLLKFKIGKTWLNEHIGGVVLKRYNDGWKDLPTLKASDDDNYAYYEAISPGFSVFAIAISGEVSVKDLGNKTSENKTLNESKGLTKFTGFFGKDLPSALTGWIKNVNKYVWIVGMPFVVLLIIGVVYRERIFSKASKEEREFDRHLRERAKLKEKEERDREKRLKVEQEIREEKESLEKKDLDSAMNRAFNDKKGIFSKIKVKEPKTVIKKEEIKEEPKVEIVHEEKKRFFGFFKNRIDSFKERREEQSRRFEFKDIKK